MKKVVIFLSILFLFSFGLLTFSNPVISNVSVQVVYGTSAVIVWTTDVPSTSRVTYGTSTPPSLIEENLDYVTEHRIELTGLTVCTTYFFSVTSNDGSGSTTDDNNGNYYTFKTGLDTEATYNSLDVPVTILGESISTSTLTINDNKIIGDINVSIGQITTNYPGSLEIYIIAPDSTEIPLIIISSGNTIDPNFENTVFDDEAEESIIVQDSPFTGTFRPTAKLSHLYGKNAYGVWTLKVKNDINEDATLESWGINIHYNYEHCEPHLKLNYFAIGDQCTGTGNGNNDGIVDAGEDITLSMTVYNDGNADLTNISGTLTTSTQGVNITNGTSNFPNINRNSSGTSSTNFQFKVDVSKNCGDIINFNLHLTATQKPDGWDLPFSITIGDKPPQSANVMNEDFDFHIPVTWTVIDGGDNTEAGEAATWFAGNACKSALYWQPDLYLPFATVDSNCAGELATQDEELITPAYDLSFAGSVYLSYDNHFVCWGDDYDEDPDYCHEYGDIDVRSSLTNNQWVNVERYDYDVPLDSDGTPVRENINISTYAAGATDVQIRFHYYDACWDMFWALDNIVLSYSDSTSCYMNRCCPSMTTPSITNIYDNDLCSQSGITITFSSSTPSTRHDLYVDNVLALSNVTSPINYDPEDQLSHNYKIRAVNYYEDCYIESTESSLTDEDRTPGTPSAPTVLDVTPCSTNGISISWESVSLATYLDLLVDDTTIVSNVTSPYTYQPQDNISHSYKVRGRNDDCTGSWSTATLGVDENHTPETPTTAPAVSDKDACQTNGVEITWSSVSGANSYDLRVDGTTVVQNVTSPYTYIPGDNNLHTYEIRGKYVNASPEYTCYGEWSPSQNGTDINDTPGQPVITNITDNDPCATNGITITYTAGSSATSHDLYKDSTLAVSNFTSGSTYQPGDNVSHNYVIRAKNNTCYTDSASVSGTDVNDTPGQPTINSVTDVSACATSGVQINYTPGSGATSHDLYRDGVLVVSNYVSGAVYQPGDNVSHSYVVRAKKNTCYTDSTSLSGTDVNDTPQQPTITSITDNDGCQTNGITIVYTPAGDATSHDLYKDGGLAQSNFVSGSTYQPGDTLSHTYVIRAIKGSCYNDSLGVSGTDINNTPGAPVITNIIDNDDCATTGITINYTLGSNALVHDLWKDGALAQANFVSGSTYNPGDNNAHTYVIRGKRASCYTDSEGVSGTDANILPSAPTITSVMDKDLCALSGVTISWGVVEYATSYDIAVDSTSNVVGNTSSLSYDYSPGDSSSHNYYVRAKNSSCIGSWSSAVAGTDVNDTPQQPTITSITDNDGCQTNGITIVYTPAGDATSHDLYKDGGLAQSNFVSGSTYQPGDTLSHTYVIRAIKGSCYNDSLGVSGTDINNTPGAPVITNIIDNDDCATTGITINYTLGSNALVHDLWKDGALAQANFVSGSTYNPGDNNAHTYVIRGKRASCYTDSEGVSGTDANILPSAPTITSVMDKDLCALSGVTISWGVVEYATSYDIAVDSTSNVVGNTSSLSYDYSPGDSSSHNYYVRAKNSSCIGSWSSAVAGTDGVSTIGQATISSVTDKDQCALSGVTITWNAVAQAVSYDIAFNNTSNIVGNTSSTSYDYSPGDTSAHNYYVRAKDINSCPGEWSVAFSGTDVNNKPGQPVITNITDNDGCSLSGIKIYYTPGSGGVIHDLYEDGILVKGDYTSGAPYSPGNSNQHTYVIRAKRSTCYTDSEGYDAADINGTPTPITLNATNYDGSCGIKIDFTGGAGATQFDLWVDGNFEVQNITSGYVYQPSDNLSHNYMVKGINGTCFKDSDIESVSDPNCGVPPGEVGNGTNFTWTANQTSQVFSWNSDPLATGYRVYRGVKSQLVELCGSNQDFCQRVDQTGTSLDISSDSPQTIDPTNRVLYYLIVAYNGAGEGPAGNTTACGAREIDSTGNCP